MAHHRARRHRRARGGPGGGDAARHRAATGAAAAAMPGPGPDPAQARARGRDRRGRCAGGVIPGRGTFLRSPARGRAWPTQWRGLVGGLSGERNVAPALSDASESLRLASGGHWRTGRSPSVHRVNDSDATPAAASESLRAMTDIRCPVARLPCGQSSFIYCVEGTGRMYCHCGSRSVAVRRQSRRGWPRRTRPPASRLRNGGSRAGRGAGPPSESRNHFPRLAGRSCVSAASPPLLRPAGARGPPSAPAGT